MSNLFFFFPQSLSPWFLCSNWHVLSNFMAFAHSQVLATPRYISSLGFSPELLTWVAGHLPSRHLYMDVHILWPNMNQTGLFTLPPVLRVLHLWPLVRQRHHNLPCGPTQKPGRPPSPSPLANGFIKPWGFYLLKVSNISYLSPLTAIVLIQAPIISYICGKTNF